MNFNETVAIAFSFLVENKIVELGDVHNMKLDFVEVWIIHEAVLSSCGSLLLGFPNRGLLPARPWCNTNSLTVTSIELLVQKVKVGEPGGPIVLQWLSSAVFLYFSVAAGNHQDTAHFHETTFDPTFL